MQYMKRILFVLVLLAGAGVKAVDNPLSVVLKGAPLLYGEKWYGLSGQTNGVVLASTNLVDWSKAGQVFNQKIAGIDGWLYRNGLVYLYVQDKAYALSQNPTHSFTSLRQLKVSGSNLSFFEKPDGALFALFKHKGSNDRVGVQKWDSPVSKARSYKNLLHAEMGLWDAFDSADFGHPSALHYRGNDYFLYAANHSGPRTGDRVIGVAVSTNLVAIRNFDKQTEPILMRNLDRIGTSFKVLLPTGEFAPWRGRYLFEKPKREGWEKANYIVKGWREGTGGFGYPFKEDGVRILSIRTAWRKNAIWIRRTFILKKSCPKTPVLAIRHEGPVEVFLNGKKIYTSIKSHLSYDYVKIPYSSKSCFVKGENVLAVHALSRTKARYRGVDFGLFDAGDVVLEPVVVGVDSPRIIDGLNGFEKWMFYDAWWNGVFKTGLDRVFFYGKKMVVDGPTTAKTKGYHPPPTPPTFSTHFSALLGTSWKVLRGEWLVGESGLTQADTKQKAEIILQQKPAKNYLFETHLSMDGKSHGAVGVVGYSDGKNKLLIRIHPKRKTWEYQILPDQLLPVVAPLPKAFKWEERSVSFKAAETPWHRLRVVKNGGYFDLFLDRFKLTLNRPIQTKLKGAGQPGLLSDFAMGLFKNVIYTQGWDEYGAYITGWGKAVDGTPASGEWTHSITNGLVQKDKTKVARAFKGDLLDCYEFTVQAKIENLQKKMTGSFGVFPLFRDKKNYLKAVIDLEQRRLVVSGRLHGKPVGPFSKPLKRQIFVCPLFDKLNEFADLSAWVFQLPSSSIISALNVRWLEGKISFLENDFELPVSDILLRYVNMKPVREPVNWEDSCLDDVDDPESEDQKPNILNRISFTPIVGSYIGMGFSSGSSSIVVNRLTGKVVGPAHPGIITMPWEEVVEYGGEGETDSYPRKVLVDVELESSYFFRCVKLKDRVLIELNGKPMLEVEGSWPDSQVGLLTENQACSFDGITLIHHPKTDEEISSETGTNP